MNISSILASNSAAMRNSLSTRFSTGTTPQTNPFHNHLVSTMTATGQINNNSAKCWVASVRASANNGVSTISRSVAEQVRVDRESGNHLFSWMAHMDSGWINANVLWSEKSTLDNPMVIVKGYNADGSPYEIELSINSIDPKNATIFEIFALKGYFDANGIEFHINIPLSPIGDMSTRFDFVTALKEQMDTQQFHRNWQAFDFFRLQVEALLDYIARISNN